MTAPVRTVALIGAGSMGDPMACRIADAGYAVTVCDVSSVTLKRFAGLGAATTSRPADCGTCDAVIVLVATPEQVRAVVSGLDGLMSGPAKKTRYLVVMSTVSPGDMLELAASLAGTAIRVVDAPVSGGTMKAVTGDLTVMAGGEEADVAALRPLFATMATSVFYCGPLGTGQATKVVNNVVAIANLMISAEAYSIALHNGLRLDRLMPVLEASSGRNFLSKSAGAAADSYATWSSSPKSFESFMAISRKDIELALVAAEDVMRLPAVMALRALFDASPETILANWQLVGRGDMPEPNGDSVRR